MTLTEKCKFLAKLVKNKNMGGYENGLSWHLYFDKEHVDFEYISTRLEEGILSEKTPFYWEVRITGDFK